MSEPTNNQTMIPYLLGSLPAAETERMDELSVSDGEFAEALRAAEHDLVDAYVQGELIGATLESFETHYLASPLRRQRLAFAETFKAFAEKDAPVQAAAVQREASAAVTTNRSGSSWRTTLQNFKTRRLAMQWGLAFAALVLLFAGSWLVFDNVRMRRQNSEAQAQRDALLQQEQERQKELEGRLAANVAVEQDRVRQERERLEQEPAIQQRSAKEEPSPSTHESILSLVLTPQLRGSSQVPSVSILAKTAYVAAQLQLDPNDYSTYRVALIDPAGNRALWRSGNIKPRSRGAAKALDVTFPAGLLKPQTYTLRVSGVPAGGILEIVSDYSFKVVK